MPTKSITVQKISKDFESFEFSLCNNSDVAIDSSRIFRDFSHTKILRYSKHIVRFCFAIVKSDAFPFPSRKIRNRRSGAEIVYARIENTLGSKNVGKISKTHASSKPKSESLITVFSARCTDSPFYSFSLSLSLSLTYSHTHTHTQNIFLFLLLFLRSLYSTNAARREASYNR